MRPQWLSVPAVFACAATVVHAEPADPAAAEALFRAGREASEHRDYAAACARFEESYRLDPAPGTLLNIAKCDEALNRLSHAWEHYRRLLDELDAQDSRVEIVRERLAALEPRVPRLTVSLGRGMPPEAEVRRDGLLVTQGGFGVPVPVDPGNHMLTITAVGRETRSYAVTLAEGEARTIEVEAGAPKPRVVADVRPKPSLSESRSEANPWRTAGYAALAVGGASAIATGVLAWRYFAARAVIDDQCNAHLECTDDGLRATGAAQVFETASIVAASVAVAGIGGGFALLWTHPEPAPSGAASLVPTGVVWTTAL
jgi:hypothetical protein